LQHRNSESRNSEWERCRGGQIGEKEKGKGAGLRSQGIRGRIKEK